MTEYDDINKDQLVEFVREEIEDNPEEAWVEIGLALDGVFDEEAIESTGNPYREED